MAGRRDRARTGDQTSKQFSAEDEIMGDTMRAWMADGKGGVALGEAPMPIPLPDQALVQVKSTAVARGEIRHLPHAPKGRILGLDLAGVVVKQAANGSGPPVGARVIAMTGYSGGGWGQFAAMPAAILGVIPDELGWHEAAALPNSGLTALYGIRHGQNILGMKVLVTGATGAVGRLAAQFAKLSGAEVTGTVSRADRTASLKPLGLHDVVVQNNSKGPFHLVFDTIGGSSLSHALEVVDPDGVVVTVGGGAGFDAPPDPAVVPLGWFVQHPSARLQAENVGIRVIRQVGVARDLTIIGKLAAAKRLDLDIEQDLSWREANAAIEALMAGKTRGRTILQID
jgi:NADPH:quinone reductase-like Zn-dependent oxidoreductase